MIFKTPVVSIGLLAALLFSGFARSIGAQQNKTAHVPPTGSGVSVYTASDLASLTPAATPGDVSSPEALLAALHDSISGPAGPIDWNRYRSLFMPGARNTELRTDAQGVKHFQTMTVDEDIAAAIGAKREEVAWYDVALVSHIQRFNNTAVAVYSDEARRSPDGKAIERAVTTCEMLYDGRRWWVASANWDVFPLSTSLPPELDPLKQKP